MKKSLKYILITIASIIVVAGLGSLFVNLGMGWFDGLRKPSQWIPNFVIPVVWSVIYLAFAIILSLWINNDGKLDKEMIIILIINGALNILWCLVYFTLNQLFLGNVIIIINVIFGLKLLLEISKTKRLYGYILSIYPIWLLIASSLNLATWILN